MWFFFLRVYSPDYDKCSKAMYSMSIYSLDVWQRVTLGLTEIWTTDPLPMIPHQVETQFIASQPYPVSVSGLIPSLSAAPATCWYRKCQYQAMVTQTVWEYPHQLGHQTVHYKTLPRISPVGHFFYIFFCGSDMGGLIFILHWRSWWDLLVHQKCLVHSQKQEGFYKAQKGSKEHWVIWHWHLHTVWPRINKHYIFLQKWSFQVEKLKIYGELVWLSLNSDIVDGELLVNLR